MIYRYFIGFDVLEYLVFIYEYYIREVKNLVYVIVDIGFKGFKMDVKCYVRYVQFNIMFLKKVDVSDFFIYKFIFFCIYINK